MNRCAIVRILLSLLLLVSQQMAFAHAMSHLASARARVAQSHDASDTAKALAQDQACSQCLAFAQLGAPLAASPCAFAAPAEDGGALFAVANAGPDHRCVCPFLSRAPPV